MPQIIPTVLSKSEWKTLTDKYGDGKIEKRVRYEDCNDDDVKFKGHSIAQGRHADTGSLTGTGFLRNQTGQVVAGVDNLPT